VDPFIAPPVLLGEPPALEVEVSETSVSFSRDYPAGRLAEWHADALGLSLDAEHAQREEGTFVSPGLWVDAWHVFVDGGSPHTFRFAHAGSAVSEQLLPIFTAYYRRVQQILEMMQQVIDIDGPRDEVSVNSDAALLQVRRIVNRLITEESVI
jgi:vanillate O-demethylase monooxygenase subunit